jgi:hypothetical protein
MKITQELARDILRAMIIKHDKAGRVFLCRKPVFAADREFSPAQKEQHGRFREAALYAKSAVGKEAIYTLMAEGTARTAYNVAIADWFHPPEIEMIDLSGWTGRPGESIRVRALDDVMVRRVMVLIADGEDKVIEQGAAVQEEDDSWWVYTTTETASSSSRVIALAEDLPGHVTQAVAEMAAQIKAA